MGRMNERELNAALYERGNSVFRSIKGFESSLCLRAVRCPDRKCAADFIVLQPGPEPKLGIVECERERYPDGARQLRNYIERFRPAGGNGDLILDQCLRNSLEGDNKRSRVYNARHQNLLGWIHQEGSEIDSLEELSRVLTSASRTLVPILICYRETALNAQETAKIRREYHLAPPLFAGTVSTSTWSLQGAFV